MGSPPVPRAPSIRFPVDPGDVPAEKAARRLHLTPAQFEAVKPRLLARGFPPADPDTGMYDLEAIDRWRHLRHPHLFPELKGTPTPSAPQVTAETMGQRFREARQRQRAEQELKRKKRPEPKPRAPTAS